MRFYNYINENKIKTDIAPFLKEFGKNYDRNIFIYRGVSSTPRTYTHKITRKNRKPRFIRKDLHDYLGKVSKQLWGWNIRTEGVFTGGYYTALTFGHPCIFLPIGKYSYVWAEEEIYSKVYNLYDKFSNTEDIYRDDKKEGWDITTKEYLDSLKKDKYLNLEEIKEEIRKLYTKYKTKGIDKYYIKFFESIFKCDEYYLINLNYWEDFKTEILGWK